MEGRRDHLRKDPCTSTTLLSTSSLHSPPPPPPTSPSDENPFVGHPDNSNMVISQSSSNLYPISSDSSLPIGAQNTSSSNSSHAIGSPTTTTVPQSSLLIGQLAKPRVSDYMLADNSTTRKVRPGRQLHFADEYSQVFVVYLSQMIDWFNTRFLKSKYLFSLLVSTTYYIPVISMDGI